MTKQRNFKYFVSYGSIVLLVVIIVGYSFFKFRFIRQGVVLNVETLTDGLILEDQYLDLKGLAKNAVKLSVLGRNIGIDENGRFEESLLLPRGYTIIDIRGEDKFGKEKLLSYRVYVNKEPYKIINS